MNKFLKNISSIIVSGLLLLSFSELALSQKITMGAKGGFSTTSHFYSFRFVSGDIDLNLNPQLTSSLNGGFIVRKEFKPSLRLQLEPSIMVMGAKYNEGFVLRNFNFTTDSKTELTYVQLPIVLQFSTVPPKRTVYGIPYSETTYHLTTGAYGGYLLDARFSGENTGAPIGIEFQGEFSNSIKDQYLDFDAGLIIGVGFEKGRERKLGFETRLLGSVITSGSAQGFRFNPYNIGMTFNIYLMF